MTTQEQILEKHCLQLMEHFDSVLIIVTKRGESNDPDETSLNWRGMGNAYANSGAANAWVMQDKQLCKKETL